MKPSKNNVYCISAQHTKMLFPTESKANNFIKFNADEIRKENGFAPVRSYFCDSCGGWHVTSHEYKAYGRGGSTNIEANYLSNRRSAKERENAKALTLVRMCIGKTITLMNGAYYVEAKRFLCYAEKVLNDIKGCPVQMDRYKKACSEFERVSKQLHSRFVARSRKQIAPTLLIRNCVEIHGEMQDIETLPLYKDDKDYVLYSCMPRFICSRDGKFYYALCSKHLDLRELEMTLNRNETKHEFCYLHIHHMGIVGVDDITEDNPKAHFSNISDIIPGEILDVNSYGLRLEVLEISPNSGKYLYQRAGSYDYWIQYHNKYVHFFSGHVSKYTCIVTDKPMDTDESVDYYRKTRL